MPTPTAPDHPGCIPMIDLYSEEYGQELWDRGVEWDGARVWVPYEVLFPTGSTLDWGFRGFR